MKLIFFDEAKNDPDYPHYHLGAVSIDEKHLSEIEGKISAIAETSFGTSALSAATELHAAEIYHRKNNFKDWPDFGKRIEVIAEIAKVLSIEEARLISIQVNCNRLRGNQSPSEIAFMFLCERANDLARSTESLGMLIGDRENDRSSERYSTTLSGYRASGTEFAFGRNIHNLVDSVHFTHSHLSRFLQLADVYTWLLQFRNRNRESKDARHCALLDVLKRDKIDLGPAKYKEWPKS